MCMPCCDLWLCIMEDEVLCSSEDILRGLMVSVIAITRKVRRFKPGWGRWIFKDGSICSTPFFGREVKPSASCYKILWKLKEPLEMWKKCFVKQKSHFLSPVPSALLLDDNFGRIARELWRINQAFSPVSIIPLFSMPIYNQEYEQWAHWWLQIRDILLPHWHDRVPLKLWNLLVSHGYYNPEDQHWHFIHICFRWRS
jgi:hypothetical protein